MRQAKHLLAFVLLLTMLLTGCGGSQADDSSEPQTTPQPQADRAAVAAETPEETSPPPTPEPKEENQPSDNASRRPPNQQVQHSALKMYLRIPGKRMWYSMRMFPILTPAISSRNPTRRIALLIPLGAVE